MLSILASALFVLFWSTGFIVARAVTTHADVHFFLLSRFATAAMVWGIFSGRANWRLPVW